MVDLIKQILIVAGAYALLTWFIETLLVIFRIGLKPAVAAELSGWRMIGRAYAALGAWLLGRIRGDDDYERWALWVIEPVEEKSADMVAE